MKIVAGLALALCYILASLVSAIPPQITIDDDHVPKFFVVGGQKCGTSSLWQYIKDHPQFVRSARKETFLFCTDFGLEKCVDSNDTKTVRYKLRNQLWRNWKYYMSLGDTSKLTTGDMTTTHLSCACCITSIKALNPHAKIIAILRDPARRTRSRYLEQKYLNAKIWHEQIWDRNIRSLEELAMRDDAIIRDCLLSNGNPYSVNSIDCVKSFNLLGWSMYDLFLPHIYSTFSESNILILYTEDLARDPAAELRKVESFLGIDEWIPGNRGLVSMTRFLAGCFGNYGWQVEANSTENKFPILHKWAVTSEDLKGPPEDIRSVSSAATHMADLMSFNNVRAVDERDYEHQYDVPDDFIGSAVCKALRRTYRTMAEFASRGWIPPLPSEWHCP